MRRVFGPIRKPDGSYKIEHINKIEEFVNGRFMKAQRLRWLEHVPRMDDTKFQRRFLTFEFRVAESADGHKKAEQIIWKTTCEA